MTASRRGTAHFQGSSNTVWPLLVPTGSIAGDWFLAIAATGGAATFTLGSSGLTQVLNAVMGTGQAFVGFKKLTAADISAGTVTIGTTASTYIAQASASYAQCDGFGPAGTATFRSGSSANTTAAAATVAAGQKCLVLRAEKSTNNPGPVTVAPASPAVAAVVSQFPNSTSWPSVWIGEYTGGVGSTSYTLTDPIATANGVGIQIPIIDAVIAPAGPGVSVWDGAAEVAGCTVTVWDGTKEVSGGTVSVP